MDPLDDEVLAFRYGPVDERLHAGSHHGGLLAETDDHGIGALRHRDSQTSPRVERAVVDRWHEVRREYTTHDFTDGICRGDPGDTQPVCDLRGDGGLADAGGPA